jgi:serine/threonine protein kinase
MAIAPGTKLGPYEVSAAIGAGGMGEVYRARDARLNRDVAIKVLPASFADDRQRLHRFEQEALAAAALNHPNILAVYDIGTQEGGAPYIVSELLEGDSLRDRLRAGPIPLRKATEYALQVSRGLTAAHDKGIIHRDLKPENIFITRDGRVKLLDFGLAKLTQTASDSSDSETRTIQSDAGTVLGTVGYMSPEQVRGKPADARSDLFSFGAVLYEMLSGKRAFHGETSADTMSAILHSEPPELTETNRTVPPALERIVRHCLEKSPEERFRSAHDVAFDLETLSTLSSTSTAATSTEKFRRRNWIVATALALVIASAGALLGRKYVGATPQPPRFHRITYERGSVISARFSPDGNSVVYDAAWLGKPAHLFSTPASGPEPRALDLETAHLFSVSKTGEAAVGLGGRVGSHLMVMGATLARSPLGGGAPREILQEVVAADWAPDGTLAVAHKDGGRMRLESPVGKVLYETSGWISDLRFNPAGDKIAFLDHPFFPDDRGWVAVIDKNGNNNQRLSGEWEAEDGLAWTPDGKEIWFSATSAGVERALTAVSLTGKQRQVLTVPGTLRVFDIYADGRVLLGAGHERVGMTGLTPDNVEHDLSWSGWTIVSDLSSDGKVLFDEQSEFAGANYMVAIRSIDGSPPVKLGDGGLGRFSPDGKWVTVITLGESRHFALSPTGAGTPKEVLVTGLDKLAGIDFFPDGNLLLIGSEGGGHGERCYLRSMEGGPMKAITPEGQNQCRSSPDSASVVATDNVGDMTVFSVRGGPPHPLPGTHGMIPVRWADNHSILAFQTAEIPARVFQIDVSTGKQKLIKTLAPGDRAGVNQLQTVAASPDGRTFAYSYQQILYDLYVVERLK